MHRSIKSTNKGFTLLEAMIVIAVITITFSGVISLYFRNIEDASEQRDEMILNQLNGAWNLYILNDGNADTILNNSTETNQYVIKTLLKNYIDIPRNNIAFDRLQSKGIGDNFHFSRYGNASSQGSTVNHQSNSSFISPWSSILSSESAHPTNLATYGEEYWTPKHNPPSQPLSEDIIEPIISHFI